MSPWAEKHHGARSPFSIDKNSLFFEVTVPESIGNLLFQLLLCGAQSCGLPLRMPSRSSLTRGIQEEKIKLGTMTRFSCEARVSCYTSTTQMPTVTGLSGLSFLGMSFEHEHLTAEVRHKNLPLIPSINSRANNVANNVTPRSYPGGQCEAAQHHGKQLEKQPLKGMDPFLTSLLPFFF